MKKLLFSVVVLFQIVPVFAADPGKAVNQAAADIRQRAGFEAMIEGSQKHIASVGESGEVQGSGPFPARMEVDLALSNATIYRPGDLAEFGRDELGLVIWGNGGCSDDGASARHYLAELASHGYLVIAPGKPLSGPLALQGAPKPTLMSTTVQDMREALDWALAENHRPGSLFYNLLDPQMIAVGGHSCGAMQAMILADDPRIASLLIHNSAVMPVLPDNPPLVMHEKRLQGIQIPTLMLLGGESDVVWRYALETFENFAQAPAFFGSHDTGHQGTLRQPYGGEDARIAVEWLAWHLQGDNRAAKTFKGPDCDLCKDPAWAVQKKRIP